MEIYYQNIPIAAVALYIWCVLLNKYIWRVNLKWAERYPDNSRHPFTPWFVAIGVTGVHLALLLLVDWRYVALAYAVYMVYGGQMWKFHQDRWLALQDQEQQVDDSNA